jgi:hypothetical protein
MTPYQKLVEAALNYYNEIVRDGAKWAIFTKTSHHPNQISIEWGHKNERAIATRTYYIEGDEISFFSRGHT